MYNINKSKHFSILSLFLLWCLTGCGVVVPFNEEDWEIIFSEERNNFLYAANWETDGNKINILQIDDNTGRLTYRGFVTSAGYKYLSSDLEGTVLFSANFENLNFFSVADSGDLTPLGSKPTMDEPIAVTLDVSGRHVYYATLGTIFTYLYDKTTRSLTDIATCVPTLNELPVTIQSLICDPDNNRLFLAFDAGVNEFNIHTYATNPLDGKITETPLASYSNLTIPPQQMCVHPSGRFLYTGNTFSPAAKQISAFQVNEDGSLTALASYATAGSVSCSLGGLVIDPAGRYLFTTVQNAAAVGTVGIFTIDSKTGLLTHYQNYNIGDKTLRCLSTDPWGRYLYVSPASILPYIYIFKINNGMLTEIEGSPFTYSSASFTIECLFSLSKKL